MEESKGPPLTLSALPTHAYTVVRHFLESVALGLGKSAFSDSPIAPGTLFVICRSLLLDPWFGSYAVFALGPIHPS